MPALPPKADIAAVYVMRTFDAHARHTGADVGIVYT
jgi:hypothetical protein